MEWKGEQKPTTWNSKMKILVTGGRGFLGKSIASKLLEMGYQVSSASRQVSKIKEDRSGVRHYSIDLTKEIKKTELLRDVETVFHVAAKAGVDGKYSDYYRANYIATKNILSACKISGVKNFIYTSSPSVVFNGEPIKNGKESLPYVDNTISPYSHTKALAEKEVLQSNCNLNFRTVSLRPHLIWGQGDPHLLPKVIARHKTGDLKIVGDGKNNVDLTHIDNVVHAHILAMEALFNNTAVGGNAYFITQNEPVPLWSWLNQIFEELGLPPLNKKVSFKKAYFAGHVAEKIWKTFNLPSELPMSRFVACQLSHDHWFSSHKAQRDFGYNPVLSMKVALEKTLPWLKSI